MRPLTRPWSSASTRTTSGRSSLDLGERLAAVGHDVEQLDRLLRVQQAADVLRDLRHVLDDEEANLVLLGPARHRGSTIPRARSRGPTRTSGTAAGRRRQGRSRDEDRPAPTPGPSGAEVVVAGERLDAQARRPRRSARARPAPTSRRRSLADPADAAARPGGPPRRSRSGATVPVAASCWARADLGHDVAGLGVGRGPTRGQPAVVAGEVVGVGQPRVDDGEAARREVGGERRERVAAGRVAGAPAGRASSAAMNARRVTRRRRGRRRSSRSRLDERQPAVGDARAVGARGRGPGRASPGRGRRR